MSAAPFPPVPNVSHMMDNLARLKADERNAAKRTCLALARQIREFEQTLRPDEEVAARLVSAPDGSVFHIEDLDWVTFEMVCFSGTNSDGQTVRLLQSVAQVSVMLVALPAKKVANRIGFLLVEKHEK